MSEEQSRWPREATEEEIRALRPSSARLAAMVVPALLDQCGPPEDFLPGVEVTARIIVDAFSSDPWLQELGEDDLSREEALEIAEEVNESLRLKLFVEGM